MADSEPDPNAPLPKQIPYIIGNEACERFSFYGMRNVLQVFLSTSLLVPFITDEKLRELGAKDVFHTFVMGVYFFPLLGGWLSDRFFGKYRTVLWFSVVYCIGQLCLAMFVDDRTGYYVGLGLIALGSGGIKPLVASFVGDQFDQSNKHRAKVVFDAFYWSINFGSFFGSLLIPLFVVDQPRIAFGIPGVLMLVATIVFWLGRDRYVRVPPSPPNPDSFLHVAWTALSVRDARGRSGVGLAVAGAAFALAAAAGLYAALGDLIPALCLMLVLVLASGSALVWLRLDQARGHHPDDAVDGVRAVLRVLIVFALITPFWSLFDQKASTWVVQGTHMTQATWFSASQMQAANPALVMILIPLNNLVVFPWLRKRGHPVTALGRMTVGMVFAGFAWVGAALIQLVMDGGESYTVMQVATGQVLVVNHAPDVWIFWQLIPYALLTTAEVLVSATGLEFAYSQAPLAMKGVIMSFFNLTVTIGGLWTILANHSVYSKSVTGAIERTGLGSTAFLMLFFAGFAFATALAFRFYAKRYKPTDHYNAVPPVEPRGVIPKATARKA